MLAFGLKPAYKETTNQQRKKPLVVNKWPLLIQKWPNLVKNDQIQVVNAPIYDNLTTSSFLITQFGKLPTATERPKLVAEVRQGYELTFRLITEVNGRIIWFHNSNLIEMSVRRNYTMAIGNLTEDFLDIGSRAEIWRWVGILFKLKKNSDLICNLDLKSNLGIQWNLELTWLEP